MNISDFKKALSCTTPIFFGYLAIGIPFGLMLVSAGYPWWMSIVMSVTMYSGTGQYMAVGLFAAGAKLPAIIIAEILINIRHIVYGLSLIKPFKNTGLWKPYLIFSLTDETYAVLTSCEVPKGVKASSFYATICMADHFYWILGSVIGAIAGNFIPQQYLQGVDFALTALFIVLLIEQIKKSKNFIPPAIGIACTLLIIILSRMGFIPSEHILIIAITFGIAVLILFKKKLEAKKDE
jgi:4-azaleucine resistance transporter AzlC